MDCTDNEDTIVDLVCQSTANKYFDQVIGHIEDIVLGEKFQGLHENFLEEHWTKFDNKEENKLIYMDIFEQYTTIFESFFMKELQQRIHNFNMEKFVEELNLHENLQISLGIIDSEIFELLYSFSNFQIFKDIMLDYCLKKEGRLQHMDANVLYIKPLQ